MKKLFIPYKIKTIVFLLILMNLIVCANAQPCVPMGDQVTYGTNNVWIGYAYQGKTFNTYKGFVNEGSVASPNFDESFGGNNVQYNTNGCPVTTEVFSVRYKLTKTFANATYDLTVGGDDGYRLSIDGGATWIINQWNDHSYQTTTATTILNGTYNLIIEYYENTGSNRISFSAVTSCLGNGNPAVYGTSDSWIGYIYQGMNFNTYKGYINRGAVNGNFDENFGTANGPFATSNCSITTELFSARFRLQKTFVGGTYSITVGGDDGYRLSLDGGATWIINRWNDQSYTTTNYSGYISGTHNMVLEYYENGGENRISFNLTLSSLPITIKSWSAMLVNPGKAHLSWVADAAMDFDHFIIQRSTNASSFQNIQTIASRNTGNNYSYAYDYTDLTVPDGVVYYRLAMVDKDGTIRFSGVQTVSSKTTVGITIQPTIVTNRQIVIRTEKSISAGTINIINMNGQIVQSEKWNPGSLSHLVILKSGLESSTYLVRIKDEKGLTEIRKIIVQ